MNRKAGRSERKRKWFRTRKAEKDKNDDLRPGQEQSRRRQNHNIDVAVAVDWPLLSQTRVYRTAALFGEECSWAIDYIGLKENPTPCSGARRKGRKWESNQTVLVEDNVYDVDDEETRGTDELVRRRMRKRNTETKG